MTARTTRHHLQLDIKGALANWPLRHFEKMFRDESEQRWLTPKEAKRELLDLLSNGWELLPYGHCEGFDKKTGCPGHALKKEGE